MFDYLSSFRILAEDVKPVNFCSIVLDDRKLAAFKYAVKHHYWFVVATHFLELCAGKAGNG